jgi:hypothetical protein
VRAINEQPPEIGTFHLFEIPNPMLENNPDSDERLNPAPTSGDVEYWQQIDSDPSVTDLENISDETWMEIFAATRGEDEE